MSADRLCAKIRSKR